MLATLTMIQKFPKLLIALPLMASCSNLLKPANLIVTPAEDPHARPSLNVESPNDSSANTNPAPSESGATNPHTTELAEVTQLLSPLPDDGVWIPLENLAKERPAKRHVGAPSSFRTTNHVLGPARGHSHQSLVLSGGPRLKAHLFSDLFDTLPKELKNYSLHSSVDFPISLSSELGPQNQLLAQAFFNQGILQIHGFQTLEAERSFRTALHYAPNTAMIYWGLALANTVFWAGQTERASIFIQKAKELVAETSPTEKQLIEALALVYSNPSLDEGQRWFRYCNALKEIANDSSVDEIRSLFVEAAWEYSFYDNANLSHLGHTVESLDGILNKILEKKPLHPVHHYRIHLWDDFSPEIIKKQALNSARDSGYAGPHVAHMWHMAGHSYSGLGRFQDAQRSQEISARLDHNYMSRSEVMPYEIHNYFHNNTWLVGTSLHVGKFKTAKNLLKDLIRQPRHPLLNNPREEGGKNGFRNTVSHGWMRYYSQFLKPLNFWEDANDPLILGYLKENNWTSPLFESSNLTQFMILIEKGEFKKAQIFITNLEKNFWIYKRKLAQENNSLLSKTEIENLEENLKYFEGFRNLLSDLLKVFTKDPLVSVQTKIEVAISLTKEKKISLVLASDLYASLEAMMTDEQRTNYQSLINSQIAETLKETSSTDSLLGLFVARIVHGNLGEIEKAIELENQIKQLSQNAEPHPVWQLIFGHIPHFNFNLFKPDLWASQKALETEFLALPSELRPGQIKVDEFGNLEYQPRRKKDFTLDGVDSLAHKLEAFNTARLPKPLLVFFYLGKGCPHCMEQLAKLNSELESFEKLGVEVLAVSTDPFHDLLESLGVGTSTSSGFGFTIFSDSSFSQFKTFGAFDEFESLPLHGVFLLGRPEKKSQARPLLWRDIGPEPFMNFDFLRPEIKRLLKIYRGV